MILGLDIGKRRIGVAKLSHDGGAQLVLPFALIDYRKPGDGLKQILEITASEPISALVLGFPLNPDGSKGEMALLVEKWRSKLIEETGLKVHLCDERMTTKLAQRNLSALGVHGSERKTAIDMAAAVLILESWLARERPDSK